MLGMPVQRLLSPILLFAMLLITLAGAKTLSAQESTHHLDHSHSSSANAVKIEVSETHEWAKSRLAKSPRHQKWVKVKHGNREVNAFIVYPEVKTKATAVVVIHEIFGLTEWVQTLTDQLAEAGYIAIASDFLSGMGPNGGGTTSFTERSAVGQANEGARKDLRPRLLRRSWSRFYARWGRSIQYCGGEQESTG